MPVSLELAAEAANILGISTAAVVQKDYNIVEVLNAVLQAKLPEGSKIVFSGGTCLSKAHMLTKRMSEDIDLKTVIQDNEGMSNNVIRQHLSKIKDAVHDALLANGFEMDKAPIARNNNKKVEFFIRQDVVSDSDVLRKGIKLELFNVPLSDNTEFHSISSMINQVKNSDPEIPRIECVSVLETAAEKFVSLTRRVAGQIEGTRPQATDQFIVRHLYDLHFIAVSPIYSPQKIAEMAGRVALADGRQFQSWFPSYRDDPISWTQKAIDHLALCDASRENYERFQDEMVFGPRVDFDVAIATLQSLGAMFCEMIDDEERKDLCMK